MFAVIMTGGKQYKVAAGDTIKVEKLDGDAGSTITLGQLLCLSDGGKTSFGDALSSASVTAEIVRHDRADKIIIFKKKRRQNYRRKNGHRQHQTVLKITGISTGKKAA